ncbi:DUF2339 domain-containing protein [Actinophytocola sediminis]
MTADRIAQLADALVDVGHRIDEISAELRVLRPAVTPPPPVPIGRSAPVAGATHQPTIAMPPAAAADPPPMVYPPYRPPEPPKPPRWQREEGFRARVLALAGGAVTLAGVVLLLVLAVQRGYLGPLPRVLLGAGFGLVLLGIGLRLRRNPAGHTGAMACAATGITVLYLDIVAATTLFEFLPAAAGLAVGLAVAALGVLLADRWHSETLAVFVVLCCAVSAPVLTGGFVPLLLGFLLMLQLGATPVHLGRQWRWLSMATAVPAILGSMVAIVLGVVGTTNADSTTVAYLGLVTSVAQIGVATAGAARRPEDGTLIGLVLLAPVPAMLSALLLPQLAAIVLPGTVGALLILVWALGLRRLTTGFTLAAGGAGSVAVLQATLTALDGSVVAIVLLAQALLLTLVAHSTRYPAALAGAGLFAATGLGATLVFAAPLQLLMTAPRQPVPAHVAATAGLTGLLLAATAVAMCVVARRGMAAAGVIALYGAAATVLSSVLLISPDRTGFLLGHVLVTVSWTVGALVLLVRGIDSAFVRTAGMSLVGAALVKLVVFDMSSLDGMARVAVFLVAGLVLLAAGTRYAKLLATRPPRNP